MTGDYILGNGTFLTGIVASGGGGTTNASDLNSGVLALTYGGTGQSSTGSTGTGNVVFATTPTFQGNVVVNGNVTADYLYGNIEGTLVFAEDSLEFGNLTVANSVTATSFSGTGGQFFGIQAVGVSAISGLFNTLSANSGAFGVVAASGQVTGSSANFSTVGSTTIYSNISGGNAIFTGQVTGVQGNLATLGATTLYGNVSGGNVLVTGQITGTSANYSMIGATSIYSTDISLTGTLTTESIQETTTTLTGATGVVVHDWSLGSIFYHTTPAANFTVNVTNLPAVEGRTTTLTLVIVQGATGRMATAVQIAGVAQTIRWEGGFVPAGTASKWNIVTFSFVRAASAWTVFGQSVVFG